MGPVHYNNASREHRTPLNVDWRVPGLMAGNVIPAYDDEGGRVVRRLATFTFDTLVKERDTRLKDKIRGDELPAVFLACVLAYHDLRKQVGDDELRKHLPASVLASEDAIRAAACPVYDFLRNGDSFYEVLHDDAAATPLQDLKTAFQNHVRCHRHDGAKWTGGVHAIKMAGFAVDVVNVCKVCGKRARKTECGKHYDNRNHKKVTIVLGMRLRRRDDPVAE